MGNFFGIFQVIWEILTPAALQKLANNVDKVNHDGSQISTDIKAWMQMGVKIATDLKNANSDLQPVITQIQQLKK